MTAAGLRETFKAATLARDADAIAALLADDVVLRSPVVPFPFEGRAAVTAIYRAVLARFEELELLTEVGEESGAQAMRFRARILGRPLETAVFLTERDGRIVEVALFARPLAGAAAI